MTTDEMIGEKTSGDYKTESRFIEFIGGNGYVNFLSREATIEGKFLSGSAFTDLVFKLKIYDDGTLDFDEVDSNETTKEERQRLLEIIEDKTLTSFRKRLIVNELKFFSIEKIKGESIPLYLSVDYQKPIEKLTSLFDDSDSLDISNEALDNLNVILDSWIDDENILESNSNLEEDNKPSESINNGDNSNDYLIDQFAKLKKQQLDDLKTNKSEIEKKLTELNFQFSSLKKTIEDNESKLELVESRIDSIQPNQEPNGYYFNVSERKNEITTLDEKTEKIIRDRVSEIKAINLENFMNLFISGEYHIKISKTTNNTFELIDDFTKLPQDLLESLNKLNLSFEKEKMVYFGELSWGEIVNKMIKSGFEQNPEFDKFCGSNSYSSKK
jgi:uncharacterized coiled-coil protein SlyX